MSEAAESKGFVGTMVGPDNLAKANVYRIVGLVLTVGCAFATLGTALLLKDVPLIVFIGLGLGAFCTFVSSEMRRRLKIEEAFHAIRADVAALKAKMG